MKKVINIGYVLLAMLAFGSCKNGLRSAEYVKYVQDSGNRLNKKISVENWEYVMQYKPYDYIVLMENKGKGIEKETRKRLSDMKGTAWFNISFKLSDGSISPMRYNLTTKEEYEQRYNYFLNEAVRSIQMVYGGKDTLRPVSYLFENNFNLTPQETMVVGFELPKGDDYPKKDMQLSYNDQVFKNGIVKAMYKSEDLKNIPNLIY